MKFIDLFAGLGGFHIALTRLGHKCVFASEIDPILQDTYEKNFGLYPFGDIKSVIVQDVPAHDILCAGFPCQPFSKAGEQPGLSCPKNGNLFDNVIEILEYHKPTYLILENVPNLDKHNKGKTWEEMKQKLQKEYHIAENNLSPHQFGIPQIRERIFVVGIHKSKQNSIAEDFLWPQPINKSISINDILSKNPSNARKLTPQIIKCLSAWQKFLKAVSKKTDLPSFPIWSMEFAANYPYETETPYSVGLKRLSEYKGNHGINLKDVASEEILNFLPSYARTKEDKFPKWKIQFIRQNREFYQKNKIIIDKWMPNILEFPQSLQKLEWNCKGEKANIWNYIIQFRASGVRVKRQTTAPSLVAMTTTQVPIIAWEKRYMTAYECARLQSMSELRFLPPTETKAFKALGNAVNAEVVERIGKALFKIKLISEIKHLKHQA